MGNVLRIGSIGLGSSASSAFTYWKNSGLFEMLVDTSKLSSGKLYNQCKGTSDYITVTGSIGSATYALPNNATYIADDSDYCWFKPDGSVSTMTSARLVGYDFARTIVKYDSTTPYMERRIGVLKSSVILTTAQSNKLRNDFQLSTWWSNVSSNYGYTKGNRAGEQSIWYYEPSAPSGLGLTVLSSTSIRLDFTDNSGGIATHVIERSPTDENNYAVIHTNAVGVVTFTDTGLSASTKYYYRIRALHVNQYSGYCTSANATTQWGIDADAQALFDRMTAAGETPADARKTIINAAFTLGKTKTFWTKLDAVWTMAAHGTASAKMNWLSTSYTLGLAGAPNPTFTADQGYAGDGTNGYIRTYYIPSAGGKKFVQNSASMGLYSRSSGSEDKIQMGGTNAYSVGFTHLTVRYSGDLFYQRITGATIGAIANTSGTGFFAVSRVGSTAFMAFKNKVKTDVTGASDGITPEIFLCCYNSISTPDLLSTKQLAFAFVGQGLTEAEMDDLYDVFVGGYLTSINAL